MLLLMKIYALLLCCIVLQGSVLAQVAKREARLQGRILPEVPGAQPGVYELVFPVLKRAALTDQQGRFTLEHIPFGNQLLLVHGAAQACDTFRVAVDLDTVPLGDLPVAAVPLPEEAVLNYTADMPELTAEEVLVPLTGGAAADALGQALRAWSTLGYRYRGYGRDQDRLFLDGLELDDGGTGILMRMLTAVPAVTGIATAADYSPGTGFLLPGLPGNTIAVTTAAALQRRQTHITYGRSDGSWTNRIRFSHATGITAKGWALSLSGGYCWSNEGYVPGTFYREYSLYLGLSCRIGKRSMLHAMALAMPLETGLSAAATAEAMDLAGTHYYNPAWGYQDGRVRNARIARSHTPLAMLHYVYTRDSTTCFHLLGMFRTGSTGNSLLDWYDAPDPRPDYYRNMPSAYRDDPLTAARITEAWRTDESIRQLDWNGIYAANRGKADSLSRHRSGYVLAEDHTRIRQLSLAAYMQKQYRLFMFTAGLSYDRQQTAYYRKLLDLLSGDYFVNTNRFAERAYPGSAVYKQNDLNDPDREVYVGDAYSYRYILRYTKAAAWFRAVYNQERVCLSLAGNLAYDGYQREGLYRTGLFASDAYGPSPALQFYSFHIHAGISYALSRQQDMFVNVATGSTPPAPDDVFIAPRNRNTLATGGGTTASYTALEAGYRLHARWLNGGLTFFLTDRNRLMAIKRFYHEDYYSFVNYVMEGLSTRSAGVELALTAGVTGFMSVTAAACKLRAVYRSRPDVRIYKDNDTAGQVERQVAYLKDYFLPGAQSVYMLACDFRLPRYIRAGIRGRAASGNHADINPARRTDAALGLTSPGSPQWLRILEQERLPAAFMLDCSVGKTCYLYGTGKRRLRYTALSVDLGISNILNDKNTITSAYEQLRFDYQGHDPGRFPNKYRYAYGVVYTVTAGLRF